MMSIIQIKNIVIKKYYFNDIINEKSALAASR